MNRFDIKIANTRKLYSRRRVAGLTINGSNLVRRRETSCRDIFKYKKFIIKFDPSRPVDETIHHSGTMFQCQTEAKIWSLLTRYDKRYFVPVLFSGTIEHGKCEYDYIVQPFVKIRELDYENRDQIDRILKRLQKKYGVVDIVYNSGNTTVDEETHFKILDYGMANFTQKLVVG